MSDILPAEGPSRQVALQAARAGRRPKNVSRTKWKSYRAIRVLVGGMYPRPCPSVSYIGKAIGRTRSTTSILLGEMVELNLIDITHNAGMGNGKGGCKTSLYQLPELMDDASQCSISGSEIEHEENPSGSSSTTFQKNPTGTRPRYARPVAAATRRGPVEEPSRDIRLPEEIASEEPETWDLSERMEQLNALGRQERKVFQKKPGNTAARTLIRYFAFEWEILEKAQPEIWKDRYRCFDSRGEAGKYLKDTLLAPDTGVRYTEDEVKAMIDEFFDQLAGGRVALKPGQSAWKRFTSAWRPISQSASHTLSEDWWK